MILSQIFFLMMLQQIKFGDGQTEVSFELERERDKSPLKLLVQDN